MHSNESNVVLRNARKGISSWMLDVDEENTLLRADAFRRLQKAEHATKSTHED